MEIICEKKNIYKHILYTIIYIYMQKIFYRKTGKTFLL